MDSQTTQIDSQLTPMPASGMSNCSSPPHSEPIQVGSAVMDEWQKISPSCDTVVCRTSALEVFSQACSTYIDCELDWSAESQSSLSPSSTSEVSVDGPRHALHIERADAKSVDAALPLLLDELEAFIANLREESHSELFASRVEIE